MSRVLCAGECMIEVRYLDAVTAGISYAGDTYNTAVYLRRTADVLGTEVEAGYLTGLGDDEDSAAMRAAWAAEGIVDRSVRLDGLLPGLYTVRVDDRGERRFSYWRSSSAARHLFATTEWVEHLEGDVIHLSGITLQLASPDIAATPVGRAVDTTAAGDAFAGGYLAARLASQLPVNAGRTAADVAAAVVSHPGAIIPRKLD